eukprot:GHVT01034908.1.p1 GENE.GHVT01034908.1~~GHVT01034908.1.p1  ORF type:complete len:102 (-),score=11.41 GHVT01034908.1:269-574(-)
MGPAGVYVFAPLHPRVYICFLVRVCRVLFFFFFVGFSASASFCLLPFSPLAFCIICLYFFSNPSPFSFLLSHCFRLPSSFSPWTTTAFLSLYPTRWLALLQ